MPTAKVQGPDGRVYTVDVPDGATDEQIIDFVSSQAQGTSQPQPVDDSVGRQLGLTARHAIAGPAKVLTGVNDAFTSAFDEGMRLLGSDFRMGKASPMVDEALDATGLPKPQGDLEEGVATVSEFVSGAGLPIASAQKAQGAAKVLAENPMMQGISAALGGTGMEAAQEADLGPGWQAAASIGASMIPGGVKFAGPAATRAGFRGSSPDKMVENIAAFEGAGTQPSVGQATQNRAAQAAESLLAKTPGGSGRMAKTAERQASEVGDFVEESANAIARKGTPERAGIAIERGITGDDGFISQFRAKSKALYDDVDQFIDPQNPVSVESAVKVLRTPTTLAKGAPSASKKLQSSYLEELGVSLSDDIKAYMDKSGIAGDSPMLPYEVVKAIRTAVGERMGNMGLTVDASKRQLKQLYAALSDDMTRAAEQAGPQAGRAAHRANKYYSAGMGRIESLERVLNKNGGPEKVFNAAMSGTKDGATTLRTVMKSLPPEERKWVSSTVVRRMGKATPGQQDMSGEKFSISTYLTNWNRLSPEAKGVLFSGQDDLVKATDHVAKVAENIRDGSRVFSNPSGTQPAISLQAMGVGGGISAMTGNIPIAALFVGIPVAANSGARLMTNPNFVHWLAKTTQMPQGAATVALDELAQLSARDTDIQAFMQQLEENQVDN